MSSKVLFAVTGVLVLLLAWGIIVAAGRSLRAGRDGGGATAGAGRGRTKLALAAGAAPDADAVVLSEVLRHRGVATEEQLSKMSARELQLLFNTVGAKLPPLAPPHSAPTPASPSAETRRFVAGQPGQGQTVPMGRVFCPGCGSALDDGLDRPRFATSCPGCGRRVVAQLLGVRLTLTVEDAQGRPSEPLRRPGDEARPPTV